MFNGGHTNDTPHLTLIGWKILLYALGSTKRLHAAVIHGLIPDNLLLYCYCIYLFYFFKVYIENNDYCNGKYMTISISGTVCLDVFTMCYMCIHTVD